MRDERADNAGEVGAAIRRWADAVVREVAQGSELERRELASVSTRWLSHGELCPGAGGPEPGRSERYEVRVALPGEVARTTVVGLAQAFDQVSELDPTLGDRVRAASVFGDSAELSKADDQDLGENAWRLTVQISVRWL